MGSISSRFFGAIVCCLFPYAICELLNIFEILYSVRVSVSACLTGDGGSGQGGLFKENLASQFGMDSICNIFVTPKTTGLPEEKRFCVRIGNERKIDVSAELLSARPGTSHTGTGEELFNECPIA